MGSSSASGGQLQVDQAAHVLRAATAGRTSQRSGGKASPGAPSKRSLRASRIRRVAASGLTSSAPWALAVRAEADVGHLLSPHVGRGHDQAAPEAQLLLHDLPAVPGGGEGGPAVADGVGPERGHRRAARGSTSTPSRTTTASGPDSSFVRGRGGKRPAK